MKSFDIEDLKALQGELKTLSDESYRMLRKEIEDTGFAFAPHVWIDQNGKAWLVDGHQRFETLKRMRADGLSIPKIPVVPVDAKSLKEAKRRVLQGTSQYGEMTDKGLKDFLTDSKLSIKDIEFSFRFPEIDLPSFVSEHFRDPKTEEQEDELPEPMAVPKVKLGELYQLGEHRLLCGDSTNIQDVERLMNGEKASVWLSDPPYGINHVEVANEKGQAKGYKKIINDDLQDQALQDFIFSSIAAVLPYMKKGFAFYMWHAMKMQAYFSQAAAAAAGILFHRQLIWVKPNFVFGRGQYHWRHELCLMGWLKGDEPPFYGERNQTTVWEIGRENDKIHPTQKPVSIWTPAILNHTKQAEIIYEPFAGSGSNIIACEKENRRCFAMEIDPIYCGVILDRWEKYSGKFAVRSDGVKWSEIRQS
jgi:site-specific DNA-methyltransferase (adenine-specific)